MELEELRATWSEMSQELEKQKKLTNEIILKMTQDRYRKKFSKLRNLETVGAMICYLWVVFFLFNFGKLDTWYLQICGVLTIGFLIILPTLVLKSLKKIQNLDILNGSYKKNLVIYIKEKNRLLKLQQMGIYLSYLLLFILVPVSTKIISNKNIFLTSFKPLQVIALVVALIFMFFFTRWGYKSYKKITNSAEDILRDLDS
ncbi:hypothetical protein PP182_07440 [Maribacter sp. PR1]|uniref:Uncharacterized protein n=1 Tax=Maribacter cobaltidurans TaxID=1178778 RepID=A0ABU7ISN5_9FLAO|nr:MULTISPECIES: hypothetical protein [Maribacter]MDC6388510.1 hypothetical protein [Maribacter sp. PR1]MEE1975899.1 hypothetical protein [Maribacter cobaltidurans]